MYSDSSVVHSHADQYGFVEHGSGYRIWLEGPRGAKLRSHDPHVLHWVYGEGHQAIGRSSY